MFSLIIPVFNEEEVIAQTLRDAHNALQRIGDTFEIVVVNDGSTDQTLNILKQINFPGLRVISHPKNKGYGASMKTGIRHSRGNMIGTVDADGTYPIKE